MYVRESFPGIYSGCSLVVRIPRCGRGDLGSNPSSHKMFFLTVDVFLKKLSKTNFRKKINGFFNKLIGSSMKISYVSFLSICSGCSLVVRIPRCGRGDLGSNPSSHKLVFLF